MQLCEKQNIQTINIPNYNGQNNSPLLGVQANGLPLRIMPNMYLPTASQSDIVIKQEPIQPRENSTSVANAGSNVVGFFSLVFQGFLGQIDPERQRGLKIDILWIIMVFRPRYRAVGIDCEVDCHKIRNIRDFGQGMLVKKKGDAKGFWKINILDGFENSTNYLRKKKVFFCWSIL